MKKKAKESVSAVDLLAGVFDTANKTKNELLQSVSQEILNRIGGKIDPVAFVQEFLSRNEVEFHIKVSIKPKSRTSK